MMLYEHKLPEGSVKGFDLAYDGWTGNRAKYRPVWRAAGFDGLHLIGSGSGTHIIPNPDGACPLNVGRAAGHLKLSNITLHTGHGTDRAKAIFMGIDAANAATMIPVVFTMEGGAIIAEKKPSGQRPFWGGFFNQCDVEMDDVEIWCEETAEHAAYKHGHGKNGTRLRRVRIHGSGAENWKETCRPLAKYYPPGFPPQRAPHAFGANLDGYHPTQGGGTIMIEDCEFSNWHQPHSIRGGGGLVVQGAGLNVHVQRCTFRPHASTITPGIAVDDSGDEHFGDAGAGSDPANDHVVIRDSVLYGNAGPSWVLPMLRVAPLTSNSPNVTARSLSLLSCGLYCSAQGQDPRRIEIDDNVPGVQVNGCNTPEITAMAASLGFDVGREAKITYRGRYEDASRDFAAQP